MKIRGNFYKSILFITWFCVTPALYAYYDKTFADLDLLQQGFDAVDVIRTSTQVESEIKEWTVILYIAADNDLAPFAIRNIKQMAQVGSNEHFNIVVHLDICKTTKEKITRRYCIQHGKIILVNTDDPSCQAMDSGDPHTLISCCDWAVNHYPAEKYMLVLWNHGMGILDPVRCRIPGSQEMFILNHDTNKLELDRSIGYINRMLQRGICFDDTTKNYLNYRDLEYALGTICSDIIGGKLAILAFDACLMQMVEIAHLAKPYADVMVGSQEAGLGYGWNYADVLEPLAQGDISVAGFAQHIVDSYERSYINITSDYTMSAIDLCSIDEIEHNINEVSSWLLEGLHKQKNNTVKKVVQESRSRNRCTHFDEPSYIDLHHFYGNLLNNIDRLQLRYSQDEIVFRNTLRELLFEGQQLIEDIVFACASGKRLPLAKGISVYFPENRIHSSYPNNGFAQNNAWFTFLNDYLFL